jgi:8-amino-7-oxononanoate synthase
MITAGMAGQRSIIHEVLQSSPMFDAQAMEVRGRQIRFGDRWFSDFASCNYLGFDLETDIIETVEPALKTWGIHPSWCRLVASPSLYTQAEETLAALLNVEDTLILPTVTLIHIGVIPALVGNDGIMFLDKTAHMTLYEAAKIARDSGAQLKTFEHANYEALEAGLHEHKDNPKKLILVDGTYSMTGNYADIPRLVALARKYDAVVYIDDAHGFGVVGENPTAEMPYGLKGNGVVRHYGMDYENVLYVGGLSKAYSSLAAFVACSKRMKSFLKAYATPYDLSGPCPTASLQTVLAGLAFNERHGDEVRRTLYRLTCNARGGLRDLGFHIDNNTGFPILSAWVGDTDHLIQAARILWDNGILITLAPYPMVRKGDETLRITVTAANTDEDVNRLVTAFAEIRSYLDSKGTPLHPGTTGR